MAIKYNVVQKPEPGVPGGGVKKWYASTAVNGEADIDLLINRVAMMSTMSSGDVQGVIYTLVDVIVEELAEGNITRLGQLGDFRVSISSHGFDNEEDVNAQAIRRAKINFRPGPKLKRMLKNLTFEKAD